MKSVQYFNIYPRDKMIITRSNQETLKWLTQIDWQKMSGKTLTDEAMCFFGELQTKRPNTVKSKLAEFLKKEDQLRKCVLFKIMRERGGFAGLGAGAIVSGRKVNTSWFSIST